MKKIKLVLLGIIIVSAMIFTFGCVDGNGKAMDTDDGKYTDTTISPSVDENSTAVEQTKEVDTIKEKMNQMTLEEKIGQMMIVGLEGYKLTDEAREMIDRYHVGGFILFKRNVEDAEQLLSLVNSLKEANSQNRIPLFMSIDEEGGRVTRVPDEFVKIPPAMTIGKVNNQEFSFGIGSLIGEELKALGLNMDFGPVLDINSNPKNPVIGDRAFGTTVEPVVSHGVQTMKGIQSQGIISVVKHFPGHGDTAVDSHVGLPVVNNGMDRLKSFELVPFKNAIENNADAVMVAHILMPGIDPENPASLSKTIISDILRKELGFHGVVMTDDMTMGAVADNYDIGEAAVKSINAGSDVILVCHGVEMQRKVINAVKSAVDEGRIDMDRVDESIYRILKLKERYELQDKTTKLWDIDGINNKIRTLLGKYVK